MKPMISTKNMIHSFSSFLHRSIAVRSNALCAATCVYSPILSRTLLVACFLLLPLAGHAVAWFGETLPSTGGDYYLYSIDGSAFIKSDGKGTNNPTEACLWTFTSNTSSKIQNNEKYLYRATGDLYCSTGGNNNNATSFTISNIMEGTKPKYCFYYSWKVFGVKKMERYLAYSNSKISDSESQTYWYLIPKSQVQNHIEVSSNNISFNETIGTGSKSETFTITGCSPEEILIDKKNDLNGYFELSSTSIKNP